MISLVWGGAIHFSHNENINDIKTRLLSPEALTKRVAILDNVKSLRFSWSELEALITAPVISGRRLYVGDATRPNTLTWVITLNGASLSTDMAQRAVVIKISKPERSGIWEDETRQFIADNRRALVADVMGQLCTDPYPLAKFSRWSTWERDIVQRLPEPADAQKVILERQQTADVEEEEAQILEEFFASQLGRFGYETHEDQVFIPSQTAARWFNWAHNTHDRVASVSRVINQLIEEGKLYCLRRNRCNTRGRGFVWAEKYESTASVWLDLEERIREKDAKKQDS